MYSSIAPTLTVPLNADAHQQARQFAAEQADSTTGKRVYLNTLAVWAVHRYLTWMQIDTDLAQSHSWNVGLNALFQATDLVLPQLGRLECCPVLPGDVAVAIAPTPLPDVIGYMAVQLNDRLDQVQLLGFVSATVDDATEQLPLERFQPLDALFDRLDTLAAAQPSPLIRLGQWLQHQFGCGWQAVEELIVSPTPRLAFRRTAVRRARSISLQEGDRLYALALVVTLVPDESDALVIHLQLCPLAEKTGLPAQLKLQVLTETGDVFGEVIARDADTFIQYELTGQPDEHFGIHITLGETQFCERFMV
ncbi:DUF1822 family protein [Oculatella sp. LEGE 06141]|uniref:DUF1822 family protein n=1 Tax=Oculatella sp. LEGE 06141 TaxID=1828648 RepID=UPI00187E7F09|nr:DUF1822 family protein [Oculatella sp. LEGE 06141]MBE9179091.1 DUF1822 family protein [Oculatella sp. LEGE 06141]